MKSNVKNVRSSDRRGIQDCFTADVGREGVFSSSFFTLCVVGGGPMIGSVGFSCFSLADGGREEVVVVVVAAAGFAAADAGRDELGAAV